MTTKTLDHELVIEQLSMLRKVVGFAKLGCLPHESRVVQASSHVSALKESMALRGGELDKSEHVLRHLSTRMLPSHTLCQEAMTEVTRLLQPVRDQYREIQASEEESSFERPRGG